MQGRVLGFDAAARMGAIRGTDGARYTFSADEWKGAAAPAPNDEVDFETVDNRATGIFVTRAALNFDLGKLGQSVDTEKMRGFAVPLLASWHPLLALLTIVACFWTFMSVTGPGGVALPSFSPNLFGASSAIKEGLRSAGANADISEQISQNQQAIEATAQRNAGYVSLLGALALALYLIPLGSAVVIVQAARRTPASGMALLTGTVSVALPIALVFAIGTVIQTMLGDVNQIATSLGSTGYHVELRTGGWAVAIIGTLQLAASLRLIQGGPADFMARQATQS